MNNAHAFPHTARVVLGALAALALLAAMSAAAARTPLTSEEFAPGWQEHAHPLINMGNGQLVAIGEPPFGAPSVFSFFPPNYVIPQTALVAPEFALENTGSIVPQLNMANYLMHNSASGLTVDFSTTGPLGGRGSDPGALVDYLGMIFMHSQMPSDMRAAIVDNISTIAATNPSARASVAAYLVVTSPQYRVMH